MRPYAGSFISIDPGSAGTGIAHFIRGTNTPTNSLSVLGDAACKTNWMSECNLILNKIEMHLWAMAEAQVIPVFIEEPQYFSSFTGVTAAKSGSLAKLVFFYGRLWQLCLQLKLHPYAVPIQDWKGQLSKHQIIARIEKKIGVKYDSHAADAVGIGLYMRGIL